MSDLSKRLAQMTPEQIARLREQVSLSNAAASASQRAATRSSSIERRPAGSRSPLSDQQRQIWLDDQIHRAPALHNNHRAFCITGHLDTRRLARCLNHIVQRHETLRSVVRLEDGEPLAQVLDHHPFDLRMVDVLDEPAQTRSRRAEELAICEASEPFDVTKGPLFRFLLVRLAADHHLLLFTAHHLVFDGWSTGVLTRELATLYEAATGDTPDACDGVLAPLPIQYGDYAAWQAAQDHGGAASLAYWKKRLAELEPMSLPCDFFRPPVMSHRGGCVIQTMPADLAKRLKSVARDAEATLYMVLLAAFNALLMRYCNVTDMVVSTQVSGRQRLETEPLIGCFTNMLLLRTDGACDPTFAELVERVRASTLCDFEHQDTPYDHLVAALGLKRDPSRAPIHNAAFQLRNFDNPVRRGPTITIEPIEYDIGVAKIDLALAITERPDALEARFDYCVDLFDRRSIKRMARQLATLLEHVADAPHTPLSRLRMGTDDDPPHLVGKFSDDSNGGAYDRDVDRPVHTLIAAQARQRGDQAAVICGDHVVTYGELDAAANRFARGLRSHGVGPDRVVAICLDRGPDLIMAMLATHKAGGAYLLIDTALPPARIHQMINDAGPVAIVTSDMDFDAPPDIKVLRLGADDDVASEADVEAGSKMRHVTAPPDADVSPDHLAYVVYTSGSTGTPKGVAVSHRSLTNHTLGVIDAYDITELDRRLQFAAVGSDVIAAEVFPYLAMGGTLVQWPGERFPLLHEFMQCVRDHQVTVVGLPAGYWHQWVNLITAQLKDGGGDGDVEAIPPSLRLVISGMERADPDMLAAWLRCVGKRVRWCNAYGPSETTITATVYEASPDATYANAPVPIGRPLPHCRAYLLDASRRPVPPGVPGELYIGGLGVARGYLNRPDLTAQRFLPDPFVSNDARMYRTGDLARLRPDGQLEFLGRMDDQLKLRGFRIEPGEIEAIASAHSDVGQCVVVAVGDPHHQRLVAYVTPAATTDALEGEKLKRHLTERLPAYMIPSQIVVVDALPISANGKIDRQNLPDPGTLDADSDRPTAPPRTPTEHALAEVWQQLLRRERLNRTDNFFDLGGHSLMALRMIAEIERLQGIRITMRQVFEAPSLASLATTIDKAAGSTASVISPVERRPESPVPMSDAQREMWLAERMIGDAAAYKVCVAVRLRGGLDAGLLERAINAVVARHEALRTGVTMVDDEPWMQILQDESVTVRLERHTIDMAATDRLSDLLRELGRRPFDLEQAPLIRADLLEVSNDHHVLLITLHHLMCDEWSVRLILNQISAAYRSGLKGQADQTPSPAVQFADFAAWQRQCAEHATDDALAYWTRQLAAAPTTLDLPTEHGRPSQTAADGRREPVSIDPQLAEAIRRVGAAEGATPFMTFLTAFGLLLHRYSGTTDLVIATPLSERDRPELQDVVGLLLTTLPIRMDFSAEPSYRRLLREVRQATLDASAHRSCSLGRLVQTLQPPRSSRTAPLAQVMFALIADGRPNLDIPGLDAERVDLDPGVSKAELTLLLHDRPDGGIEGCFEYRTNLFDLDCIRRMSDHFRLILRGIAEQPDRPVSRLPLLTTEERHELLDSINDTTTVYPRDATITELFEQRVRSAPDKVAIMADGAAITYEQLDQRANRLAQHLRAHGVNDGDRVAVELDRSVAFIVAVLAALKTGATYVPVDSHEPMARRTSILADTQPRAVVRLRSDSPPDAADAAIIDLEADAAAIRRRPAEPPPRHGCSLDPAYVIYTSGTTGVPKGVIIPHRAITRLVIDTDYVHMQPSDRIAHLSNVAFDAATFEIWGALLSGASIVVLPHDQTLDPDQLARCLREHRVTVMFVTTALFNLIAAARPDTFATLRCLLTGGEAMDAAAVRRVMDHGPPTEIQNVYGPTENTTFTTWFRIDKPPTGMRVPIGRPIANTTAYILDSHGQPVPYGVPGELYVGGDGLALGYLNDSQATADRFVAPSFEGCRESRLYRTGDRCQWNSDGFIEFLGRFDHQVKVRGFRVEPGEIEAATRRHPAAGQCAVIATGEAGDKRLVAYVTPSAEFDGAIDERALKRHLEGQLPSYMVPSQIVVLDDLPLTATGKIDRRRLPAPGPSHDHQDDRTDKPCTDTERHMAETWRRLLGVERVGRYDNLFDLGGHSLTALRLVTDLEQQMQVILPVRQVFETPTLAELAEVIDRLTRLADTTHHPDGAASLSPAPIAPDIMTLQPHGDRPPIFCVVGGGGHAFNFRDFSQALGAEQPFYGLQFPGIDGDASPFDRIEPLAARLVEQLIQHHRSGPIILGGHCLGGTVAYEMARQLTQAGFDVPLLFMIDAFAPGAFRPKPLLQRAMIHLQNLTRPGAPGQRRAHLTRLVKRLGQRSRIVKSTNARSGESKPTDRRQRAIESALHARRLYRPTPYRGSVLLLRCRSERIGNFMQRDPSNGWGPYVHELHIVDLPITHRTALHKQSVNTLATALQTYLPDGAPRKSLNL